MFYFTFYVNESDVERNADKKKPFINWEYWLLLFILK